MNKYLFTGPRKCGKTTKAISEFVKDLDKHNFMCVSSQSEKALVVSQLYSKHKFPISYLNSHITTYNLIIEKTKGYNINSLILDNYEYCENTLQLRQVAMLCGVENIFIYMNESFYDYNTINMMKRYKKNYCSFDEIVEHYITYYGYREYCEEIKMRLNSLYDSFLTDDDLIRTENLINLKFGR